MQIYDAIIANNREIYFVAIFEKIAVSIFVFVLAVLITVCSVLYYAIYDVTVLYSDVNSTGHSIQIIEKGHRWLTNRHNMYIKVDEKILIFFSVYNNTNTFPEHQIKCVTDDPYLYEICLGDEECDRAEIVFNSEFSKLLLIRCADYRKIDSSLEVISCELNYN